MTISILAMTPFQFWGYIGVASVICYGLGVMTMALLRNHDLFPKRPKREMTNQEYAKQAYDKALVQGHRDNYPRDEDIIAY